VLESGLHVRLVGARAAEEETRDQDGAEENGDDYATPGRFHALFPFIVRSTGQSVGLAQLVAPGIAPAMPVEKLFQPAGFLNFSDNAA